MSAPGFSRPTYPPVVQIVVQIGLHWESVALWLAYWGAVIRQPAHRGTEVRRLTHQRARRDSRAGLMRSALPLWTISGPTGHTGAQWYDCRRAKALSPGSHRSWAQWYNSSRPGAHRAPGQAPSGTMA